MVSVKHLVCLLLLVAIAPAASAGGIVKFHVSPVADPKVGDTVTATIYNDNNLAPLAGEVVLMLDWNPEVMKYVSSTVAQGHTKASDLIGTHNLEIRTADTVNGLPNGDEPLATVTFKIVGPGFTPIVIDVQSVRDTTGADITSKAVSQNGAVTATGTAAPTGSATATLTTVPTTTVTTVVPSGSVPVPLTTATPTNTTAVATVPTAITTGITTGSITAGPTAAPVTGGSDGSASHDSDEYTGVVTRTPTPTVTKTATPNATATSTPNVTANVATATPTATTTATATRTANVTATANTTTARPTNTTATPTATKAALPFGLLALAALGFVAARRH